MKKKKITDLKELKKVYPELWETIKEHIEDEGFNLQDFDLDYFVFNKSDHKFFVTLSSGVGEDLQLFDINGEMMDDEVSVDSASFDRSMSKDDFFDPDSNFMREMLPEDDRTHDVEY